MTEQYTEYRIEYDYGWLRSHCPGESVWTMPNRSLQDEYDYLYSYYQGVIPNIISVQKRTITVGDWEEE